MKVVNYATVALLAVSVLGVAGKVKSADASPQEPEISRLDYYFLHPNSPGAYRALAGMGVAPFPMEREGVSPQFEYWLQHDPMMTRLFPGFDSINTFFNLSACRPDYALQTLAARIAKFGANHPYVARWVSVQQVVFAACGANSGPSEELPAALAIADPTLAKLQADDRAYQKASFSFYKGDLLGALAAFRSISQSASPHREVAIFMVAAIRAGSDGTVKFEGGQKPLVSETQSIKEVQAILADPKLTSIHPLAQQLLGWIGATRGDASTREAQVKATLAALGAPEIQLAADAEIQRRYGLARQDIDRLHEAGELPNADPAWWLKGGPPADFTASRAMMNAARINPMAAWVLFPLPYDQARPWAFFSQHGPPGWSELEAFARVKAKAPGPANGPWVRLSFSLSHHYDGARWQTLKDEEALALKGDEPALAALTFDFYHQIRNALSAPDVSDRESAFTEALTEMRAFPFKSSLVFAAATHEGLQYLMTVGRVDEARRWRDGLKASGADLTQGYPSNSALLALLAEDPQHIADVLGADSQSGAALPLQNALSIRALRGLAKDEKMPLVVRARFARVAWGRTYALGRTLDADLDRLTRTLNPEMTGSWIHPLGKPVEPTDHRALLDVLRSPAVNILIVDEDRDQGSPRVYSDDPGTLKIDLYNHDDDNWWCRWKPDRHRRAFERLLDEAFFNSIDQKGRDGQVASELRKGLKAVLKSSYLMQNSSPEEADSLTYVACAPKVLAERTLDWVKQPSWIFWDRDGQDEALALAVKATHYGCYSDGPHGVYSKAAWLLLHTRFPTSPWAIKTKYWYNCFYGPTCPAVVDEGPAP